MSDRDPAQCLNDEEVMGLATGTLSVAGLEGHLDACADCRLLVAMAPGQASTLRDDKKAPPAPEVDRYVPLAPLGRGGMGAVYRARDPRLKRDVALKVVATSSVGPDAESRLTREAEALAKVSSPHVVTVYDVGRLEGGIYIAMELVEGETLSAWLSRPRSEKEVVSRFADAARGLVAAHAQGVVHRDFKPDNVMLSKDGAVKVLDFGLARVHGTPCEPAAAVEITSQPDSVWLGTPRYMAPEQRAGAPTDHRTDQYSFCVALYEALFGRLPFPGVQGPNETVPFPTRIARRVRRVLLRGLSYRPEHRFRNMAAVVAALQPMRSRRRWATGVIAAAAAGVLGFALATPQDTRDVLDAGTHEETPTALRNAHDFLTKHLVDKRLEKPMSTQILEPGKLIAESRDIEWIHDVALRGNRLTFRRTIEAEQTNFRLDENGVPARPGTRATRGGTRQYAFSVRGETILGVSFPMAASGWEESLKLTLRDGQLVIAGRTATEFDKAFAHDKEWKPAAFVFSHTYRIVDGAVTKELEMDAFNVDPATGKRDQEPYTTIRATFRELQRL